MWLIFKNGILFCDYISILNESSYCVVHSVLCIICSNILYRYRIENSYFDINSIPLQAHRALKGIWADKKLSIDIKIRLFKVRVLSILVYGAESWKITKKYSTENTRFHS